MRSCDACGDPVAVNSDMPDGITPHQRERLAILRKRHCEWCARELAGLDMPITPAKPDFGHSAGGGRRVIRSSHPFS